MSLLTDTFIDITDRENFRQLCWNPAVLSLSGLTASRLDSLRRLVGMGYAVEEAIPQFNRYIFTLSVGGQEFKRRIDARRIPVAQALAERGLTEADVRKAAPRKPTRDAASAARCYPTLTFLERLLAGDPQVTRNDDGQFSSPQLTREYVENFCQRNNLTR